MYKIILALLLTSCTINFNVKLPKEDIKEVVDEYKDGGVDGED